MEAATERAKRRGHFRQEGERRAPRRRHLAETGMKGRDEPQDVRASPPAESSRTLSADRSQGPRRSGMGEVVLSSPATPPPRVRPNSVAASTSPHQPVVSPPYFQFTSQAGEKRITSLWVSPFHTIKKSYFSVTRRMTTPRFPIFSLQGGCHHSILIGPTFIHKARVETNFLVTKMATITL